MLKTCMWLAPFSAQFLTFVPAIADSQGGCGAHGVCHGGTCYCEPRYGGPHCDIPTCGVGRNGLGCSGNGICRQGHCFCDRGWHGSLCESKSVSGLPCTHECGEATGRGTCVNGTCWCHAGYTGDRCADPVCSGRVSECGANSVPARGACVISATPSGRSIAQCVCKTGWTGAACEHRQCPAAALPVPTPSWGFLDFLWRKPTPKAHQLECSGRGICNNGTCACLQGYTGVACEHLACPNHCSQRGDCVLESHSAGGIGKNGEQAVCKCDDGFGGNDCSQRVCAAAGAAKNCSGVGFCSVALGNICLCPRGRGGADCSEPACASSCVAPRGRCVDGKCHCAVGWSGPSCETPTCDKACSGHGTCTTGGCRCEDGWFGQDCSQQRCPNDCFASRGQGT